jgi:RNA polymerase subunit RPABC4/transcription elongation factor Spt4
MKCLFCQLLLLLIALSASTAHAQSYNGQWNRISLQLTVNVESWGENCGVKPQSYYSNAVKPTEILESDGHLFFSSDGLRTDRCNTPNTEILMVSKSITRGNWKRVCETPASSSKRERIEYTLSGDTNRLTYVAKSDFDWSLKEDHCVVRWQEKRIYERPAIKADAPTGSPILKVHEDVSFAKKGADGDAACDPDRPLKRIILFPDGGRVSPREKLCFQVRGVDDQGCRFPLAVRWSVTQNGTPRNHLFKDSCFTAGDNAAESEGIFQVTAADGRITATATVEVAYPDIGDLAGARLEIPSDAVTGTAADQQDAPEEPSAPVIQLTPRPVPPSSGPSPRGMAMAAVAILLLAGIGLTIVLVRRRRGMAPGPVSEPPPPASSPPPASIPPQEKPRHSRCPSCQRLFPADARFCPEDGSALVLWRSDSQPAAAPRRGMVCPVCHRGYDPDSRFCPHDSSQLVSYETWRQSQKSK